MVRCHCRTDFYKDTSAHPRAELPPWIIRESDKLWIEKHCFYRSLKGKTLDEPSLINKFARLDAEFWAKAWNFLPEPWRAREQFDSIRTFLSQIVDNHIPACCLQFLIDDFLTGLALFQRRLRTIETKNNNFMRK